MSRASQSVDPTSNLGMMHSIMRDTGYDFDFAALDTEDAAWAAYVAKAELSLSELGKKAPYEEIIKIAKLLGARDNLKLRQLLSLPLATRLHHIMQFREILDDTPKDHVRSSLRSISSEYFAKYHLLCTDKDEEAQNKYTQGKLALLQYAEQAINTHCREKNNELLNEFRPINPGHALKEMPSSADYLNQAAQDCQAYSQESLWGSMGQNRARREYYTQAAKALWAWNEPIAYKYALLKSISDIRQQSAVAALDLTGCAPEPFDCFSIDMVGGGAAQPMQFTKPEAGGEQPMQFTSAATHTETPYELELGRNIKKEIQQDLDEGFQAKLDEQSAAIKAPHQSGGSKLPSAAAGAAVGATATAGFKAKAVAGAAVALKLAAVSHPVGAVAVGACALTAATIKVQRKFRAKKQAAAAQKPPTAQRTPAQGKKHSYNPFDALVATSSLAQSHHKGPNPFDEFTMEEYEPAGPSSKKSAADQEDAFADLGYEAFSSLQRKAGT